MSDEEKKLAFLKNASLKNVPEKSAFLTNKKIKRLQVPALASIAGTAIRADPFMKSRMWLREAVSDCISELELHLQTVVVDPSKDSPGYIEAVKAAQKFIAAINTEMKEISTIESWTRFAQVYQDFVQMINTYRGSIARASFLYTST